MEPIGFAVKAFIMGRTLVLLLFCHLILAGAPLRDSTNSVVARLSSRPRIEVQISGNHMKPSC